MVCRTYYCALRATESFFIQKTGAHVTVLLTARLPISYCRLPLCKTLNACYIMFYLLSSTILFPKRYIDIAQIIYYLQYILTASGRYPPSVRFVLTVSVIFIIIVIPVVMSRTDTYLTAFRLSISPSMSSAPHLHMPGTHLWSR